MISSDFGNQDRAAGGAAGPSGRRQAVRWNSAACSASSRRVQWAVRENVTAQVFTAAAMLGMAIIGGVTGSTLELVVPRRPSAPSLVQD